MRNLVIRSDANGDHRTVCRTPSDYVNARVLAANTAESTTVPSDASRVVIKGTADFYAKVNGTAVVPVDTTDGSASELNPEGYTVKSGDTISVISASICTVTFAYYR